VKAIRGWPSLFCAIRAMDRTTGLSGLFPAPDDACAWIRNEPRMHTDGHGSN